MVCSKEVKSRSAPKFSVILAIVLMNISRVDLIVIQRPSNTTAMVNESTYFNCSTSVRPANNRSITWFHFPGDAGGDRKYVYDDGRIMTDYKKRFHIEIDLSSGKFNLIPLRLELRDAGTYECSDDLESQGASAELIILDDEPICHSNLIRNGNYCGIDPDEVQLLCSVTFHGNAPPHLEWLTFGGNYPITNTSSFKSGNSITYYATLKTDLSMNNQSYVCQTTQSVGNQYKCNSEAIRLHYVFSDNTRVNSTMDKEITCYANTSQPCSYKWMWFSGSESFIVSNNQTLKPSRAGSHRCEATCPIGNKSCVVNAMFVEVSPAEVVPDGQKLLLVLLVVPFALIIIGITIIILRRKHKTTKGSLTSQEHETTRPDQSTAPLMALTAENENQAKQSNAELHKDPGGEYETIRPDLCHLSIVSLIENNKQVKLNDAERNKDREALSLLEGKPKCVDVIQREFYKDRRIAGVTALKDKLFIVSENSPTVEVYDAANKLSLISRVPIPELVNPFDLTSCHIIECVLICDSKLDSKPKEIIRIYSSLAVDKRWSTGDDFGNLSVSSESNVIMCVSNKKKLIEYTKNGEKIREINTPGVTHPCHAIKLNDGHFVISRGWKDDPLHQVCNVTVNGDVLKLVKSFGGERGSSLEHLNEPNYLIVDEKGFVLVGDTGNKRVLLLDSDLKFKGEFFTKYDALEDPYKMCLCKTTRNLFLVEKACQVLVFSIK